MKICTSFTQVQQSRKAKAYHQKVKDCPRKWNKSISCFSKWPIIKNFTFTSQKPFSGLRNSEFWPFGAEKEVVQHFYPQREEVEVDGWDITLDTKGGWSIPVNEGQRLLLLPVTAAVPETLSHSHYRNHDDKLPLKFNTLEKNL